MLRSANAVNGNRYLASTIIRMGCLMLTKVSLRVDFYLAEFSDQKKIFHKFLKPDSDPEKSFIEP